MRILLIFLCFCSVALAQRPAASFGGSGSSTSSFGGGLGGFGGFGTQQNTSNNTANTPARKVKSKTKALSGPVQSVIADSLRSKDSQFTSEVEYKAKDSTILDVEKQVLYLYGEAEVIYGDINLHADFIQLDWGKNEIFAHGMPDTSKVHPVRGKPVFMQGQDNYDTDTIRYNFKSRKAIISNIITQQGEGYLHGQKVKKDPEDNMYLSNARYTTCNLAEPHFHIAAKKIKLVNKQQVISGPFNFVLSGVPLPIGLPFGFFPMPKKKEIGTSGIIMPTYGEEPNNRGFYLRDGGYYWAVSENIGVKFLGQIYSKGSFGVGSQATYAKRYRYTGNLNLQFNYNRSGDEAEKYQAQQANLPTGTPDFSINWSHSPQSRRPDRSFSASVNAVSNGFNRNNRPLNEQQTYTQNTFGSSVQYSRSFGKLIRTSTSLRHDQNVSSRIVNLSANYSFGLNQFNPFVKEKNMTGSKWYEQFRVGLDINGGVSANNDLSYTKRVTTYTEYNILKFNAETKKYETIEQKPLSNDELRLQSLGQYSNITIQEIKSPNDLLEMIKRGQFRTSYSIPISLPMVKLGSFVNFTPSVSYRGDIYTKQLNYTYIPEANGVKIDTLSGQVFNAASWSVGGSMNTRFFGTFNINGKRLKAIRHTVMPSVSVSYVPDLTNVFYQTTQINNLSYTDSRTQQIKQGELRNLPRYLEGGSGSIGSAANIGFSLTQNLEAKIRTKSDTASKDEEKISLLDNIGISGSYNLLAKQQSNGSTPLQALSPISFGATSSLFKNLVNLNISGSLDPYAYEEDPSNKLNLAGRRTNTLAVSSGKGLGTWSYFNVSVGTSLTPEGFGRGKSKKLDPNATKDPAREAQLKFINANPDMYVDFDIPWRLSMNYNLGRSQQGLADAQTTQALTFNGDFSLTPKWKVGLNSGYDFEFKAPTLTTVNVHRELHCWDMSFNWTPIAGNNLRASNYSFDLRARASILQELKLSRRRSYYDRGGF